MAKYIPMHLRATNVKYDIDQQLLASLEISDAHVKDLASKIVVLPAHASPFFSCQGTFDINDGEHLAAGCHALLRALSNAPSSLKVAYRVELLLEVDASGAPPGTLRMCLAPTAWFDYLGSTPEDERIKIAKDFIKLAHTYKKDEEVVSTQAFNPLETKKSLCANGGCKDLGCKYMHPAWTCPMEVLHKHGGTADCGFTTFKENIFPLASTPGWTMFTRPFEYTRELLVMPSPDLIRKKAIPHDNVGMIQTPAFWNAIKDCISSITKTTSPSCTRIVVNFGNWETAMRTDPFLAQCHAHAHLWLTSAYVRSTSLMARRDYPPEDYVVINALELEREKLFYHRLDAIEAIGTRLADTEKTLTEVKETQHAHEKTLTEVKETQRAQSALLKLMALKMGIPEDALKSL